MYNLFHPNLAVLPVLSILRIILNTVYLVELFNGIASHLELFHISLPLYFRISLPVFVRNESCQVETWMYCQPLNYLFICLFRSLID